MTADLAILAGIVFMAGGCVGFIWGRWLFLWVDMPRYIERGRKDE